MFYLVQCYLFYSQQVLGRVIRVHGICALISLHNIPVNDANVAVGRWVFGAELFQMHAILLHLRVIEVTMCDWRCADGNF